MSTLHGQETTLDEQPLKRVRANATEVQTSCIEYLGQASQKFHSNCPLQYKTTHTEKQLDSLISTSTVRLIWYLSPTTI